MTDVTVLSDDRQARLERASAVIGGGLRSSEQAIERARVEIATLVASTIDAGITCGLSPTIAARIVDPAMDVFAELTRSQKVLTGEAHINALSIARRFKIGETSYGGSYPKEDPKFAATGAESTPVTVALAG